MSEDKNLLAQDFKIVSRKLHRKRTKM